MSNWNQNENSFNWQQQAPPFYTSSNNQQPYMGFNDFLNHYQYQLPYQTYPYSQSDGFRQRSNYNMSSGATVYPQNIGAMQHQQNFQGIPNEAVQVPLFPDNNSTNTTLSNTPHYNKENFAQSSEMDTAYHPGTNQDNNRPIASTSKLTATAEEFVPQRLSALTINEKNNHSENEEGETSNSRHHQTEENVYMKKTESGNKKNNSFNKTKSIDNTNWRKRQDPAIEPGTSTSQSITIYNTNRNHDSGPNNNSRYNSTQNHSRDRTKEKVYNHSNNERQNTSRDHAGRSYNYSNGNYKYREPAYRHKRDKRNEASSDVDNETEESSKHSNDRYNSYGNQRSNENEHRARNINSGDGTRSRSSYAVNESFKQRHPAEQDRDKYVSKDRNADMWRGSRRNTKDCEADQKYFKNSSPIKDNANIGQRERLTEQLNRGNLECLVCCDRVRQQDAVWSCGSCFHVLHLKCVRKWADSSLQEGLWRCPACQNQLNEVPSAYVCFCGAERNPEWRRGGTDTAHSCGEICNKTRSCVLHPCTLLCHPGPCPTCENFIQKKCECGATQQQLKCSQKTALLCGGVCNKALECKVHVCAEKCHEGPCQPCKEVIHQVCYCPKKTERTVKCESTTVGVNGYSCGELCARTRSCGNHTCPEVCHPGACPQCPLSPKLVTHCPCGQTRLEIKRTSCLDPIPTCDKLCKLPLGCGPSDALHVCPSPCHVAPCPPCEMKSPVSCRCGHITKEVACVELEEVKNTIRCGRKCTKKQSCGRHKCKETCCVDSEHKCPLPCTRTLSCGLHKCEDTCHRGHCQPCWRVSFEELTCRCGAAVRYPPVECGARPPVCSQPCIATRTCGHPAHHTCHPAHTPCPPCTVLTQRYCHGKHKLRKTIPCHQEDFSCGLPCGKDMPCGKHKCIQACHKGECPSVCTQTCNTLRHGCGHPCGAKCGHPVPCPSNSPCKAPVSAKCPCGRRSEVRPCYEQVAAQRKLQMIPGPLGEPIDISELIKQGNNQVTLECDLECQTEDRNRRLAIGLQIRNPDLSSKLAPKYSDYLKQMCTKDENFATRIFDQLKQLVVLSKESKQRTRSHSFQPMSRPKREFVHELCQHFGCESASYDSEPYRNIVATAYKERSWLPAMSLMEVVRRERGQRKVPPPILNKSSAGGGSAWATLSSSAGLTSTLSVTSNAAQVPEPPRKPRIDYFDMPPED